MSNNVDMSVIIPHYNDLERLKRCIDSIPQVDNVEILVIDDNSSDDVQTELENYVKNLGKNVRLYVNPKKIHSAGICRNVGMDFAKGKWILFADSDDYFTREWFEIIKTHLNSNEDVIFMGVTSEYDNTKAQGTRHIGYMKKMEDYLKNPSIKEEMNLRMSVMPIAKLIKRDLLEKQKIRSEEIRYSNDVMLSTKIGCHAEKIGVDSRVVYCITDREESLTKIKNKESSNIRNGAFLRRYIYWYKHISRKTMRIAGMRLYGIRSVLNPIKNNKDWKQAKENLRLLLKEKVPIIF